MHLKLIVSTLMLITCLHLLAVNPSNDKATQLKEQNTHRLDLFRTNSGFKGTITPINDNRIFFKMEGTFPLPEPIDTTIFKSNCQKISSYLKGIYKDTNKKLVFTPSPGSRIEVYNSPGKVIESNYSATYLQYYHGFPLSFYSSSISMEIPTFEHTAGTMEIRYSLTRKQYIITNRLLLEEIPLPKPRISQKQALEIVRHETQIFWFQSKEGIRAPGPGALSAPVLQSYCLTVYPNLDYKSNTYSYSYKYIYYIQIVILGNPQTFLVDGMTGKMSKPQIID